MGKNARHTNKHHFLPSLRALLIFHRRPPPQTRRRIPHSGRSRQRRRRRGRDAYFLVAGISHLLSWHSSPPHSTHSFWEKLKPPSLREKQCIKSTARRLAPAMVLPSLLLPWRCPIFRLPTSSLTRTRTIRMRIDKTTTIYYIASHVHRISRKNLHVDVTAQTLKQNTYYDRLTKIRGGSSAPSARSGGNITRCAFFALASSPSAGHRTWWEVDS